jgi:hypothetical protein
MVGLPCWNLRNLDCGFVSHLLIRSHRACPAPASPHRGEPMVDVQPAAGLHRSHATGWGRMPAAASAAGVRPAGSAASGAGEPTRPRAPQPGAHRGERRLRAAAAMLQVSAEVAGCKACTRAGRVASLLAMRAFSQVVSRLPSLDPVPPVWRMHCRCQLKAGTPGEIAACACRCWWRASKRGQWQAISKRRVFRVLLPQLRRQLGHFETTGNWPADLPVHLRCAMHNRDSANNAARRSGPLPVTFLPVRCSSGVSLKRFAL